MRNQIIVNKEFNILSRSIDNAVGCKVVEVTQDCFKVKLNLPLKYEKDESVELFTTTSKGQMYFETIVKEVENDILSIWFPLSYKYLQRREYSRIKTDFESELFIHDEIIKTKILNLSAGGIKVLTDVQLNLLTEYNLNLNLENKVLNLKFEPIRIESFDGKFISSGKFNDISNYDRIFLVQYCFGKAIEYNSK